jgi:hypothetical protein
MEKDQPIKIAERANHFMSLESAWTHLKSLLEHDYPRFKIEQKIRPLSIQESLAVERIKEINGDNSVQGETTTRFALSVARKVGLIDRGNLFQNIKRHIELGQDTKAAILIYAFNLTAKDIDQILGGIRKG